MSILDALAVALYERRGFSVSDFARNHPGGRLARKLVPQSNALHGGQWQRGIGRDLRGTTLGVLGLGRLGSQVAQFGKAFGMAVIAWSENLTEARCAEAGVGYRDKKAFFSEADFISIHLRLSERTRGLSGLKSSTL